MKKLVFIFLFTMFLSPAAVSEIAYPLIQKTLPMMCMPIRVFEAGQRNLKEKQIIFGTLKHAPEILFEVYKSLSDNKPSFSVTLRRKKEICVIAAGEELIPTWWFKEKCL
jgi:hypothetical protein